MSEVARQQVALWVADGIDFEDWWDDAKDDSLLFTIPADLHEQAMAKANRRPLAHIIRSLLAAWLREGESTK